MRRAALWSLPETDFYATLFRSSQGMACSSSWSVVSLDLLRKAGIPDLLQLGSPFVPLQLYKRQVVSILEAATIESWLQSCASHLIPFPYAELRDTSVLSPDDVWHSDLPWEALRGHRSLCRLRAGILELAHVNGRRTSASIKSCIFCSKKIRASHLHVLGECHVSQHPSFPTAWSHLGPKERSKALLCSTPADEWFSGVCTVARAIEIECFRFWR